MKSSKTEDALCMLGGALLGAAAMYLLDPDQGDRRRQRVAKGATGAWDAAGGALNEGWGHLREGASGLVDRLGNHIDDVKSQAQGYGASLHENTMDHVNDVSGRARGLISRLGDRISGHASDAYDQGSSWAQSAKDAIGGAYGKAIGYAGDAGSRARSAAAGAARRAHSKFDDAIDYHEGFGAGSVVGTAVTCTAAGVAAMYLLDAQRGAARRAKISNNVAKFVKRTGRTMRATGMDMANRVSGFAQSAGLKSGSPEKGSDNADLTRRVRVEFSRLVSNADLLNVSTDIDGTVIVSGPIGREEAESLLAAINQIPGVRQIINRLETRERLTEREVDEYHRQQPATM